MTVDFNALLAKRSGDVEKPKPMPAGIYRMKVAKKPMGVESRQKKTPGIEYTINCIAPGDDVDQAQLAQVKNWQQREYRTSFWLTPDAEWRLVDFCIRVCKADDQGGQASLGELVGQTGESEFWGALEQDISEKTGEAYSRLDENVPFAPID